MDNGGCFIKYLSKHEKMKQTAIDWLLENLITEPFSEEHFEYNNNCWDKAEQMEKEQIKFFYDKGHLYTGCEHGFEECYNKTFKK